VLYFNYKFYLSIASIFIIIIISGITLKNYLFKFKKVQFQAVNKEVNMNDSVKNETSETKTKESVIKSEFKLAKDKEKTSRETNNAPDGSVLFSFVSDNEKKPQSSDDEVLKGDLESADKKQKINALRLSKARVDESESLKEEQSNNYAQESTNEVNYYLSSGLYNNINVVPNLRENSALYLMQNFKTNSNIDSGMINTQEIINYLCKDVSVEKNKIVTEFVEDDLNYYFLLVYYKPAGKSRDLNINIRLNSQIDYKMIGGENILQQSSSINDYYIEDKIIMLLKFKNLAVPQADFAEIKIIYYNSNNKKVELDDKVNLKKINQIKDSSALFKNAYLGYMIGENLKSNLYSINDIVKFKQNYLDNNKEISSKYNQSFVNDFINYQSK